MTTARYPPRFTRILFLLAFVLSPSIAQGPCPALCLCTRPPPIPPRSAICYGDPHILTFNRARFDCQVRGEFILSRSSRKPSFELQGRFSSIDGSAITVVTAFVSAHFGSPTIQFTVPKFPIGEGIKRTVMDTCPVVLHVDGVNHLFTSATERIGDVTFSVKDKSVTLTYKSGITVTIVVLRYFGCYISSLKYQLPGSRIGIGGISGLFGTPNGDSSDDWRTPAGDLVPVPKNFGTFHFANGNFYCHAQWCIKTPPDSLFTYFETGSSHASNSDCDKPTRITAVDLTVASAEVKKKCGTDEDCLLDGIVGGVGAAQAALEVKAEINEAAVAESNFKFDPINIRAGSVANVIVTLDVLESPGLEKFVVRQISPDTEEPNGLVFELLDNGLAENADDTKGDLIFSAQIGITSKMAGETLSFRATPVINGVEDAGSPLVATALSIIRSFSAESGLGTVEVAKRSVTVNSLEGIEMKVIYSWKTGQRDLDTNTEFLLDVAGYLCFGIGDGGFVKFLGDNAAENGVERSLVFLDRARKLGFWKDTARVSFKAGWHKVRPRAGIDPVSLTVVLQESATKKVVPNTRMSVAIDPGLQNGCAEKEVAFMDIKVTDVASLTLNRAN